MWPLGALLLSGLVLGSTQQEFEAEVLIVGGGMAGLGAAEHLHKSGVRNFLLLEARDYIGGRVHAKAFGNASVHEGIVEVGANWVHGVSDRNPVQVFAEQVGLRSRLVPGSCSNISAYGLFLSDGTQLSNAAAIARRANRMQVCLNATAQSTPEDESVAAAMRGCGWSSTDGMHTTLEWELSSANDPISAGDLSLHFALPDATYSWMGDDDKFVHDQRELGYAAIAHEVLHSANLSLHDPRLLLGTIVDRIDTSACGAVRVFAADGRRFRARHVISTLPLGVMQARAPSLFVPTLPDVQVAGLAAFTMGNFTKLFIQFPESFWSSRGPQWLASAEHPHDAMEFHDLNALVPGFNALFAYVTGAASASWEELTDARASEKLVARLQGLFPGERIGRPAAFMMTRHGQDPFMRGAYSAAAVGATDGLFDAMVAPVTSCGVPRVSFAGEHTCDAYAGFLHGAYLSGLDAASDVVRAMGLAPAARPDGWTCRSVLPGFAWRREPRATASFEPSILV